MKTIAAQIAVAVLTIAALTPAAHPYPAGTNNWHVDSALQTANSDCVAKIRVSSVLEEGRLANNLYPDAPDLVRYTVSARVIDRIKGNPDDIITIEFHAPRPSAFETPDPSAAQYNQLATDEVAIVFLQERSRRYFLPRIRSKVRISPEPLSHDMTDEPLVRLLNEFLASAESTDPLIRLQAAEEIGFVADAIIRQIAASRYQTSSSAYDNCRELARRLEDAALALEELADDPDPAIQNAAVISTLQANAGPSLQGPLAILRADPAEIDPNTAETRYGSTDFATVPTKLRLLETIDSATRRVLVNLDKRRLFRRSDGAPYRGVRDFDYSTFIRGALDIPAVRSSTPMRTALANVLWIRYDANSVPEMIDLLDDPEITIRATAVAALCKAVSSPFSNPLGRHAENRPPVEAAITTSEYDIKPKDYLEYYRRNEDTYITYWKAWWRQNKDDFQHLLQTSQQQLSSPDY